MQEQPTASSLTRLLIYTGAAGTVILALAGLRFAVERLARRAAMAELVIVLPLWALIGAWMLSPFWGALKLQRRVSSTRSGRVVIVIAVIVLIALAANSFLVTNSFIGGKPRPTADGVTIVLVPILQWAVLGAASLLLRLVGASQPERT